MQLPVALSYCAIGGIHLRQNSFLFILILMLMFKMLFDQCFYADIDRDLYF